MTRRTFTTLLALALVATMALDAYSQRTRRGEGRRGKYKMRNDSGLTVGEHAPGFTLKSPDGKSETNLEALRKDKPVILLFGSYT